MATKALTIRGQQGQQSLTVPIDQPRELTVTDVLARAEKIQELMRAALREDIHYGVIPGTEKPSLLKPGAEKLCLTFQLKPRYQIQLEELEDGHRNYQVTCVLIHFPTGQEIGEGLGSASTLESRYRYRRGEPESTGQPVPQNYWILRRTKPAKAQELLGGKDFVARKIDGSWVICRKSEERHENPDIADTWNTVLKVAKKRALVDATLQALAASDTFNHEEEDEEPEEIQARAPAAPARQGTTSTSTPEPTTAKGQLWATLNEAYDKARVPAELRKLTGKSSISELSEKEAQDALLWFEHGGGRESGI